MGSATITVGLTGNGPITVSPLTLSVANGTNNTITWTMTNNNATILGFTFSSNWGPNVNPGSVSASQWTVNDANGFGSSAKSFTYTISCANPSVTTYLDPEIVNNATSSMDASIISSPPGTEDQS